MTPDVFALVGVSAILHATWNVLLKTTGDPLRTSARLLAAGAGVYVVLAGVVWLLVGRPGIPPEALGLGFVSGLIEAAFFILLSTAYRLGDLSVVYPVARGSAPLFAVVAGVVILGEQLGPEGWLGVLALLGAILAFQRPWRFLRGREGRGPDRAVVFALLTGVAIASYSAVDRVGARLTEPWLYAAIFYPVAAVGLAIWVRFVDGPRSGPDAAPPAPWGRAAVTGLLSVAAYVLILFALAVAPLTIVAPLRESAVMLVAAWGSIRLSESRGTETAARLAGALLVVVGVALLALD